MNSYGNFFRIVRRLIRPFFRVKSVPDAAQMPWPAVYICRHKNMSGPIRTLLWLPRPVRPWVFSVFCESHTCYRQFHEYTLTQRLHWPVWLADIVARMIGFFMPKLLRSMGVIPVYRGSARSYITLRATLQALKQGDSVILYPDINYTDTSDAPGDFYRGYLLLGTMYHRATGRNLQFVPLRVGKKDIQLTPTVVFNGSAPCEAEMERVAQAIHNQLA